MKKTLLSLALALVMCLGLFPTTALAVGGFTDVAADAYYADAVSWAVENNITSGTSASTFSPDRTCTRGEIITFLWRQYGAPRRNVTETIRDISESDFFYWAVRWAREKGLFAGDEFYPHAPCTRLMAVEFLWKVSGSPDADGNTFTDVSSTAVNWALSCGVTSGTSETTFSPDKTCTRGEIVTFLYRSAANAAVPPIAVGTYVNEQYEMYQLEILSDSAIPEIAFYLLDPPEPPARIIYATLRSNGYVMQWIDIRIVLHGDYVEVELTGDLAQKKPYLAGRYNRLSD